MQFHEDRTIHEDRQLYYVSLNKEINALNGDISPAEFAVQVMNEIDIFLELDRLGCELPMSKRLLTEWKRLIYTAILDSSENGEWQILSIMDAMRATWSFLVERYQTKLSKQIIKADNEHDEDTVEVLMYDNFFGVVMAQTVMEWHSALRAWMIYRCFQAEDVYGEDRGRVKAELWSMIDVFQDAPEFEGDVTDWDMEAVWENATPEELVTDSWLWVNVRRELYDLMENMVFCLEDVCAEMHFVHNLVTRMLKQHTDNMDAERYKHVLWHNLEAWEKSVEWLLSLSQMSEEERGKHIPNNLYNVRICTEQIAEMRGYANAIYNVTAQCPDDVLIRLCNVLYAMLDAWADVVELVTWKTFEEIHQWMEKYAEKDTKKTEAYLHLTRALIFSHNCKGYEMMLLNAVRDAQKKQNHSPGF